MILMLPLPLSLSSESTLQQLQSSRSKELTFAAQGSKIKEKGGQTIASAGATVGLLVEVASREIQSKLGSMLDKFHRGFDPANLTEYKSALFEFMDERLREELEGVGGSRLLEKHDQARLSLTGVQNQWVYDIL